MATEHDRTCIICLESPFQGNPLLLLSCGCKVAWFHRACELQWMERLNVYEGMLHCPVCKRTPRMKTNFSFTRTAGPAQEFLHQILWLFGTEIGVSMLLILNGGYYAISLPVQTYCILTIPFLIPSKHDLICFLQHIRLRFLLNFIYILLSYLATQKYIFMNAHQVSYHLSLMGWIYVVALLLNKLNEYHCMFNHERKHPLASFAISREIYHIETLFETIPSATKRLKG